MGVKVVAGCWRPKSSRRGWGWSVCIIGGGGGGRVVEQTGLGPGAEPRGRSWWWVAWADHTGPLSPATPALFGYHLPGS